MHLTKHWLLIHHLLSCPTRLTRKQINSSTHDVCRNTVMLQVWTTWVEHGGKKAGIKCLNSSGLRVNDVVVGVVFIHFDQTSPLPHPPANYNVCHGLKMRSNHRLSHPPDTFPVCDAPLLPLSTCPPSLNWNYSHDVLSYWLGSCVPGQTKWVKSCLLHVVVFLWPS